MTDSSRDFYLFCSAYQTRLNDRRKSAGKEPADFSDGTPDDKDGMVSIHDMTAGMPALHAEE